MQQVVKTFTTSDMKYKKAVGKIDNMINQEIKDGRKTIEQILPDIVHDPGSGAFPVVARTVVFRLIV